MGPGPECFLCGILSCVVDVEGRLIDWSVVSNAEEDLLAEVLLLLSGVGRRWGEG